jgi:hypothetical protein
MKPLFVFGLVALLSAAIPVSAQQASVPSPEQGPNGPVPYPRRHLDDAKKQLDAAQAIPFSEDGQKKMGQLRNDFAKLTAAFGESFGSRNAPSQPSASTEPEWKLKFSDVERDLVQILGGGSLLDTTSTTAVGSTVGTAGQPATNSGTAAQPTAANATPVNGTFANTATGSAASALGVTPTQPAVATTGVGSAASPAGARTAANPGVPAQAGSPSVPGGGAAIADNAASPAAAASAATAGAQAATASATPGTAGVSPTASASTSGAAAGVGATSATSTGAVGAGAVSIRDIGVKNLDPRARAQLEQLRTSIELFYDAATRVVQ